MVLIEFFFPKERVIALDIGSKYTKVARFFLHNKKPVLTHFEMTQIPSGYFERGTLLPDTEMNQVIYDLLKKKLKISSLQKILVAIQGSYIFTKAIQTPNYEKNMLKEYIKFEAGQYLPYDISEISSSYEELHCFKNKDKNKHFIFVAIHKKHINTYRSLLFEAGLKPHSVDAGFFCLEEVLAQNVPKKSISVDDNILILDVGFQTSGFHVVKGNQTIFSRYLTIGLESYLEELQNHLGLTIQESESLLTSACGDKQIPKEATEVIQNHHSIFCREIGMGLEYFHNYLSGEALSKCFITGGGSTLVGLQEELSKRMEVNIELLPVFRKIQTKGFSKKKLAEIQKFAGICVGLALRNKVKSKK